MLAVEAAGLTKTFPGGVEAVRGIDLAVRQGEIFGFLGPNGAGKSTTVRMLTTLLGPSAGTARVAGLDVARRAQAVRSLIGVALQDAGLDLRSTAREMLVLHARLYGMRGGEPAARAVELLDLVGLTEAADRIVGTYSGGMKRRLDLACALVHRPRVLFLDEPTAGLDPASRRAVWDEVRVLNAQQGVTVFLTTQYLEEADQLADRLAIIDHGRIVAEGSPAELKATIGTDVVTIAVTPAAAEMAAKRLARLEGVSEIQRSDGEITLYVPDGPAAVARAVQLLGRAKVAVDSVRVAHPTLDEVFLRATGSRLEGAHPEESP